MDQAEQLQKIEEEEFLEDLMLLSGGANIQNSQKQIVKCGKVGTPFYMAPEMWEDKPCSKQSDIWSLGVILYEICTHKYPYFA